MCMWITQNKLTYGDIPMSKKITIAFLSFTITLAFMALVESCIENDNTRIATIQCMSKNGGSKYSYSQCAK